MSFDYGPYWLVLSCLYGTEWVQRRKAAVGCVGGCQQLDREGGNRAEVALEAGNSPEIIFQHYRELVTGEAAKQWFGITPAAIKAEAKQLKEEGARLRVVKAEAEKAKAAKKRSAKKAETGAAVPVPEEAKVVAFPAHATRTHSGSPQPNQARTQRS